MYTHMFDNGDEDGCGCAGSDVNVIDVDLSIMMSMVLLFVCDDHVAGGCQ